MTRDLALKAITALPEDATIEDIIEALFLSIKVENGLKDVKNGNVISHADMKKEIESWK